MQRSLPKTPKHDDLRAHLLELVARLLAAPAPPDQVIARFFRLRHDQLPPAPRGFLAATAYALLRRRLRTLMLYQWAWRDAPLFPWPEPGAVPAVLTSVEEAAAGLCRWMIEDLGATADEARRLADAALSRLRRREYPDGEFPLPPLGSPEKIVADLANRLPPDPTLARAPEAVRRAARLSLPADIVDRWAARFGDVEAEALGLALGEPAPLDLRVNTLRGTREECLARLVAEDLPAGAPARLSPHGLRLVDKANVFRSKAFDEGWFEVQDEASQIVAFALDPRPTWRVLDACSGGGGKSLHLAALMKNRGEVFAHDTDAARLEPQRKRLRRAGVHNVRFLEPGTAAASAPYDAVLIDAPCMGLGTLRRNPDLAWRGPLPDRIAQVGALQRDCLRAYAPLVRPGGVLVYATCSFEPEETTLLLEEFLAASPDFRPEPLAQPLERHGIGFLLPAPADATLTLLPHRHGTDGFFIARLRRA
jgi:16S rRNA (cytosine967-C5)-methyltransferase